MKKRIVPLKLGNLTLPSNIIYAPLAGCSDHPFRQMAALFNPSLVFCEMVKMDALARHDAHTYRLLDFAKLSVKTGAQICGSKPELASTCAQIIEDLGFDVLDLNCGCPVDKVTKDGSGSGMLKNPHLIGEILYLMQKNTDIPVTVKIRAGWDDDNINAAEITKIAEQAGAKAITIHGRTRMQRYKGFANWDHIKACKEAATSIKVIGNGDIFDGHAAQRIFEQTDCDGVLISRGTLGQPWIAKEIEAVDRGENPFCFTGSEYRDLILKHLSFIIAYQNDRRALIDLRRVACWYLKKGVGTKKLRIGINQAKTLEDAICLIREYDFENAFYTTDLDEKQKILQSV